MIRSSGYTEMKLSVHLMQGNDAQNKVFGYQVNTFQAKEALCKELSFKNAVFILV